MLCSILQRAYQKLHIYFQLNIPLLTTYPVALLQARIISTEHSEFNPCLSEVPINSYLQMSQKKMDNGSLPRKYTSVGNNISIHGVHVAEKDNKKSPLIKILEILGLLFKSARSLLHVRNNLVFLHQKALYSKISLILKFSALDPASKSLLSGYYIPPISTNSYCVLKSPKGTIGEVD